MTRILERPPSITARAGGPNSQPKNGIKKVRYTDNDFRFLSALQRNEIDTECRRKGIINPTHAALKSLEAAYVMYINDDPVSSGALNQGEVKRIYTLPEHRRQGYASEMMQHLIYDAILSGRKELNLKSLTCLEGAQELYEKFGFQLVETIDPREQKEGVIRMRKDLTVDTAVLSLDGIQEEYIDRKHAGSFRIGVNFDDIAKVDGYEYMRRRSA